MTPELPGFENSWVYKLLNFFFIVSGFGDCDWLSASIRRIYIATIPVQVIFICQSLYTTQLQLQKENYAIEHVLQPLSCALFATGSLVNTYTLIIRRDIAVSCVEHTTRALHCSSESAEKLTWRKNLPCLKFFLLFSAVSPYVVGLFVGVVSPLCHFAFRKGTTEYIMIPVWYPVDVISSGALFWVACLYELALVFVVEHCMSVISAMFLYTMMWTKVRYELLGMFFEDIILKRRVRSSRQKRLRAMLLPGKYTLARRIGQNKTLKDSETKGHEDVHYFDAEMYRRGFQDWDVLIRQIKLINEKYWLFINRLHVVAVFGFASMTFGAIYMLRNPDLAILDKIYKTWLLAIMLVQGVAQIFTPSYLAHLLEGSHDKLRLSIWKSNWTTETAEVKKLLIMFHQPLNQPLKIRAFGFIKVNLKSFKDVLSLSWKFFTFLFQASARHSKGRPLV